MDVLFALESYWNAPEFISKFPINEEVATPDAPSVPEVFIENIGVAAVEVAIVHE